MLASLGAIVGGLFAGLFAGAGASHLLTDLPHGSRLKKEGKIGPYPLFLHVFSGAVFAVLFWLAAKAALTWLDLPAVYFWIGVAVPIWATFSRNRGRLSDEQKVSRYLSKFGGGK